MDDLRLEAVGDDGIDDLVGAIHAGFDAIPFPPDIDPYEQVPFAMALRDRNGGIEGGVTGSSVWGWLYVRYLWVAEAYRGGGYGGRLMGSAENAARDRACIGVWVSTYSFQASAFYQKLGYHEFGRINDFPKGHHRLFYEKRLTP